MDVVVWLRSLGLGKYEAAFRENEIDETVLPDLTHETLKELGVTAVGHRLKLLGAIAALRADAGGARRKFILRRTTFAFERVGLSSMGRGRGRGTAGTVKRIRRARMPTRGG